jgi:tetratricopeptide (TPR) repeat protein
VVRHEADLSEGHHLLFQLTESAARLLEVELPRRVISGFEDYRTPVVPALLQYLIALDAPEAERKGELIRAFELDARFPAARIELALAAVQRGDTASAISLVQGFAVGHSDWARDLGTAAWAAGETDLAMALLASAVQSNEDDGIAQAALAALLARKGEIDESFYLATRATQLEANDYRSWAALADVHRAAGKFGEACFYYNFSLRLSPDAPAVLKDAGASWVLARKPEQALKTIEKAIAVAPGDAENYGNLAFAHDLMGNAQPALEAARRAVELAAQNASLHVLHGDLAFKLGLTGEAQQAWGKAQEIDPQLTIRPEGGNIGLPEPTPDAVPAPAVEFSGPFTIFK